MKAQTAVPIVDTNIIPDRNAGMGSLLLDLQDSRDPDREGRPLLAREFGFIDVGVSRAKVSTTLKSLLAGELGMDVDYAATERPEAVPCAHFTLLGDRAEKIRRCLSGMISSEASTREVMDWHYVVDRKGEVSSVAYSYGQHGIEVWEPYFMGRTFMVSGRRVEFRDPKLDELLAADVARIEAGIDLERKRDRDPSRPAPSWDGYEVERDPLGAGLAESGIALQATDVPRRIEGRQNVLFLGNVLNHHPQDEQSRELDRVAANMREGDIVIVQVDDAESSSIDVLHVKGQGDQRTRERVRWIDTRKLEVLTPVRGTGSWRRTSVKPEIERIAGPLVDRLAERSREGSEVLVRRYVRHVFATYFRALPAEAVVRIATREAVRRLQSEGEPEGSPVLTSDAEAAHGGPFGRPDRPGLHAEARGLGESNGEGRR